MNNKKRHYVLISFTFNAKIVRIPYFRNDIKKAKQIECSAISNITTCF